MNRSHIQAHAQVVEALSGHSPRRTPQIVPHQEGHSNQINPRSRARSNFRDRAGRRKTTGFEEIRQEYYQIHHNRARAEPDEETVPARQAQSLDDSQEFFPKPSAFIRTPRRQLPPRRPRPAEMGSNELLDGGGFRTRGSKAADLFQRRRERTDQFIIEQDNAITPPASQQQMAPQWEQQTQFNQGSSFQPRTAAPPPKPKPRMQAHAPVQTKHAPPQAARTQMQPETGYHHPQQQKHQQSYQNQHPQQRPQPQHQPQRQPQHQPQRQQRTDQFQSSGYTAVDSRRSRQPLAPKSPRFAPNSPWNDKRMQVGKRFHPNVTPYQDNYNTTPKGWGRSLSDFGEDNNVKYQYEYTDTSEKFHFTPAPRINKFSTGLKSPSKENYNSRPKSWCDIELTASQPLPMRRAYPAAQRQQSESSMNQFMGQSSWGYGESDEL